MYITDSGHLATSDFLDWMAELLLLLYSDFTAQLVPDGVDPSIRALAPTHTSEEESSYMKTRLILSTAKPSRWILEFGSL